MKKFSVLILAIILIATYGIPVLPIKGQNEPHKAQSMWIEPSFIDITEVSIGYKFNVTVWVNVTIDCAGWQFQMIYNKAYLKATRAGYTGSDGLKSQFFEQSGTYNISPLPPSLNEKFNDTHNYVLHGEAWSPLIPNNPYATGVGSLSWIEFEVIAEPPFTTVLDIQTTHPDKTYVSDPEQNKIPLDIYNARVATPVTVIHDVSVENVIVSPTEVYVGETVQIQIEVMNWGTESETFTLRVSYDETVIRETEDSLNAGQGKTIVVYWNTEDVPPGSYVITVEAIIPQDDNPENNVFTWGTVTVLEVEKEPPVAEFTFSPYSPVVGEPVTFDASESYDPDGGAIVDYIWDFGDGETGSGKIVTHTYASEGTYSVTLTVVDDEGDSDSVTKTITVQPAAPPPPPELRVEITLEPSCSKGEYPEWKNITVHNVDAGCITKIDITHPSGFEVSKYLTPSGWKVNYNKEDRLITIEACDESLGIAQGKSETFRILFSRGPTEEGEYTFWITVSNPSVGYSETQKLDEYIDRTPPEVTIIYPEDGQVIKGCFWINVTAHDRGLYPCGIDRVELYMDGEFYDYMNYDPVRDVYYLHICTLDVSEKWYTIQAKAYDKAYPDGNFAWSNTVKFFWFTDTIIKVYNKLIYDNFGKKVAYGHVCSTVVVNGTTGFKPNSPVEIYFDDQKVNETVTDEYGRFVVTIHIPECPRGSYIIRATDGTYSAEARFEVYPWMFGPNGVGYVGDTYTVEGKGFAANVEVLIYYRDVAKCDIYWNKWATEWWNETDYMKWTPILDEIVVAKVKTNENGSFTATFTIPESYGGLHPIYGREVDGMRSGYPPDDDLWPGGLNQCRTFHVKTNIWITPSTGVAEQYITIYGSGLPLPSGYSLIINGEYIYENRNWSIVIDFGPYKRWVWEHNYVMNNEVDMGWLTGVRLPIYYRESYCCCNKVWNGILCWADIDGNAHEGSPFLKVPNLVNGEYTVKLYFFDENTLQDVYEYGDEEVFTIIKDPLTVRVESGNLHFSGEIVTVIIRTDVDGNATDISQMTVKLYRGSEFISTLDWTKIDRGLYYASFVCPNVTATYFIIVSAEKQYDSFTTLYAESTASFVVSQTLNGLNAWLQEINGNIATIITDLGAINVKIDDLQAKIVSIQDAQVTIETKLGEIEASIEDLEARITAIKDSTLVIETRLGEVEASIDEVVKEIEVVDNTLNEVVIKTYLGDIQGKIESIDDNIATINTELGVLKTNTENIKGLTEDISGYSNLQPITVTFSIIAAFAAIIAIAVILRRTYKK